MFQIDPLSRKAVYEQIIEQLEHLIMKGVLSKGEQIPSVRSLSIELSLNPNTIQKAYNELTVRGIIYSVPGRGNFICEDSAKLLEDYKAKEFANLTKTVEELLAAGTTEEEIIEHIKKIKN